MAQAKYLNNAIRARLTQPRNHPQTPSARRIPTWSFPPSGTYAAAGTT